MWANGHRPGYEAGAEAGVAVVRIDLGWQFHGYAHAGAAYEVVYVVTRRGAVHVAASSADEWHSRASMCSTAAVPYHILQGMAVEAVLGSPDTQDALNQFGGCYDENPGL
jgi:hypothetical protein